MLRILNRFENFPQNSQHFLLNVDWAPIRVMVTPCHAGTLCFGRSKRGSIMNFSGLVIS